MNDFVGRSLCEAHYARWTLTLTLTYRNRTDDAEKYITPRHFQDFIRSLRKRGHVVRYLVAGEVGKKGRAHFHCLLFGYSDPPEIPQHKRTWIDAWPHGHIWADWSGSEKSVRYVCKYMLKDALDKECSESWLSMSKKPMLGWIYIQERAKKLAEMAVMPNDFNYRPPGASSDRRYMMTGATRREFMRAVRDRMIELGTWRPERLNEWARKTLLKLEKHDALRRYNAAADMAALKEELDRTRNAVVDTWVSNDFQSDYPESEFHTWLRREVQAIRLAALAEMNRLPTVDPRPPPQSPGEKPR